MESREEILYNCFKSYPLKIRTKITNLSNDHHKKLLDVINDVEERIEYYFNGKDSEENYEKSCEQLDEFYAHSGGFKPAYYADKLVNVIITPFDYIPCLYNGTSYIVDSAFIELEKEIRELIGPEAKQQMIKEVIASLASKTYNPDIRIYDPKNKYLCVKNGLVNLDTGKLIPHTKDKLTFGYLDINYDPNVDTNDWNSYIESLVPERDVKRLQQAISDTLNPHYTSKKANWFFGRTNSGRSTLGNNIKMILGEVNCSHLDIYQIGNDRVRTSLYGKKANIRIEDDINFKLNNINKFKEVTGEDTYEVQVMYSKQNLKMANTAKMIFGGNSTPTTNVDLEEFYDRWNPFHFPHTFPRNEHFKLKFQDSEMRTQALTAMVNANMELRKNNYIFDNIPEWYDIRNFFLKHNRVNFSATNGFMLWVSKRLVIDSKTSVFAYQVMKDCEEWCIEKGLTGFPTNDTQLGVYMTSIKDAYPWTKSMPTSKIYRKQMRAYNGLNIKSNGSEKWREELDKWRKDRDYVDTVLV